MSESLPGRKTGLPHSLLNWYNGVPPQLVHNASRGHSHPLPRNPSASSTVAIWSPLSQKRRKQRYIWCWHRGG